MTQMNEPASAKDALSFDELSAILSEWQRNLTDRYREIPEAKLVILAGFTELKKLLTDAADRGVAT
jgi:hypothetical protein